MSSVVDLYIRVSTDEQADKGYSQRDQEERLLRFCEVNNYRVRFIFREDHSAKTFKRPEWLKLISELKTKKGKSDLVLFTKWDRFSRNAGDAYQMISKLRSLGVEPQAIEQPLDMAIPESKMMLAFYLAAPEVENDRRALNVFYGMRRAKKEGRYMGNVPLGYINKVTEDGSKYIAPKEPEASLVRWAFQELAKGVLAADQVRKLANAKGLKCSRANFWTVVRNPTYCGKIFIARHKEEDACVVTGTHMPIITEKLYYDVQDILDGNKRKVRIHTKQLTPELLPLRGFLACPKCGKMITGSGSKGKYNIFYYYHCVAACGWRHRAEKINEQFEKELEKFTSLPGIDELYKTVFNNVYKKNSEGKTDERKQILSEIDRINQKIDKARNLLLSESIDASDYREIKQECDKNLSRLEANLQDIAATAGKRANINAILATVLNNLSNISHTYKESNTERKRKIVSSIFPEKLTFHETGYRTPKINEAARLIYLINNDLHAQKNRKAEPGSDLSGIVVSTGIEPISKV